MKKKTCSCPTREFTISGLGRRIGRFFDGAALYGLRYTCEPLRSADPNLVVYHVLLTGPDRALGPLAVAAGVELKPCSSVVD